MNSVHLIGNVGQAPETMFFPISGKRKTTLSIAVNNYRKESQPLWIRCEFWEKAAENLAQCEVKKGTRLAITGSLAPNNYDVTKNGVSFSQRAVFVRVERFDVLSAKGEVLAQPPKGSGDVENQAQFSEESGDVENQPPSTDESISESGFTEAEAAKILSGKVIKGRKS